MSVREQVGQLCVHSLFTEQARKTPWTTALISGDQQMSYEELESAGNRLANYLISVGVRPHDLVGLALERSFNVIIAMLAVLKAGGVYVPIDPSYPQERIAFMLEDTGTAVILTTSALAAKLPQSKAKHVLFDKDQAKIEAEASAPPGVTVQPDDLAYVMYTSGSTGTPKGVMVMQRGMVRLVKDTNYARFDDTQIFLQLSAISFDASTLEIWGALLNGAQLVIPPPGKLSLPALGSIIKEQKVSFLWLTAGLFHVMIEERLEDLRGVKYLLAGGDVLLPPLVEKAVKALKTTKIINGYGPTENTTFTTTFEVPANWDFTKSIPIGKPIAHTSVYIIDKNNQLVSNGHSGKLVTGGLGVARGYWRRDDLTREKFIPDPFSSDEAARLYKTGDLVRKLPDGNIEFLGRLDQLVKIRGFRIEPGEIEHVILQSGMVKLCCVMVQENTPGDKRLVAYLVPAAKERFSLTLFKDFIGQKLPQYMLPAHYVTAETLPLTANGKIDKKALPRSAFERPELDTPYVAPQTQSEQALAHIWQKLLKVKQIGIHDNFFDMGGNSLLAARATLLMGQVLGDNLPAGLLYDSPTIAELLSPKQSSDEPQLDLAAEARLPGTIKPTTGFDPTRYQQNTIFLTGGTGFLGAFLIKELRQRHPEAIIHILVRAASAEAGLDRIKQNMERFGVWDEGLAGCLHPVPGDLDKPMFGLGEPDFTQLATEADVIYHVGAKVNYVQSYELHKGANVAGTRTVLELACRAKIKPVHYLSTIAIFGPIGYFAPVSMIREDQDLDTSEFYLYKDIGYSQSKWVAEKLVWRAAERGLPVTVFRPGFIMGDSRSGINNTEDYAARLIKGCLQLGAFPNLQRQRKEFTPVDFVAKAIVSIAGEPANFGKAYHLVPPHEQSIDLVDFFEAVKHKLGYRLQKLSYKNWMEQLASSVADNSENALTPFLPMLSEKLYKDKTAWELYENMPAYSSDNTRAALAGKVICPILDDALLRTYFTRLIDTGFIPPPQKSDPLATHNESVMKGLTMQAINPYYEYVTTVLLDAPIDKVWAEMRDVIKDLNLLGDLVKDAGWVANGSSEHVPSVFRCTLPEPYGVVVQEVTGRSEREHTIHYKNVTPVLTMIEYIGTMEFFACTLPENKTFLRHTRKFRLDPAVDSEEALKGMIEVFETESRAYHTHFGKNLAK